MAESEYDTTDQLMILVRRVALDGVRALQIVEAESVTYYTDRYEAMKVFRSAESSRWVCKVGQVSAIGDPMDEGKDFFADTDVAGSIPILIDWLRNPSKVGLRGAFRC